MARHLDNAERMTLLIGAIRKLQIHAGDRASKLAKSAGGARAAAAERRQVASLQVAIDNLERVRVMDVRDALRAGELGGPEELAKLGIHVDLEKLSRDDAAGSIAKIHRAGR